MKINKKIENIILDIYEISLALQHIPTVNSLEKKQTYELGVMLEKLYEKLCIELYKN